jgi:hypothetical protein
MVHIGVVGITDLRPRLSRLQVTPAAFAKSPKAAERVLFEALKALFGFRKRLWVLTQVLSSFGIINIVLLGWILWAVISAFRNESFFA